MPLASLPAGGAVAVVLVVVTAGAAVGAYGLVVAAARDREERLLWLAGGWALAAAGFLARAAGLGLEDASAPQAAAVVTHLALPVTVLVLLLGEAEPRLRPAPAAVAVASGAVVWAAAQPDPLVDVVPVLVGVLASALWLSRTPTRDTTAWLVTAGLVVGTASAAVRLLSQDEADPVLLALEGVGLGVPGLLLGAGAAAYHRQVQRWEQVELTALALRSRAGLLPGHSVAPHDADGLPDSSAVGRLLTADVGLALQPVLDLRSRAVVGQEALARLGGNEPPDRWFQAAGVHGLRPDLERVALAAALSERDRLGPGQFLAVNASPVALADPSVLELLLSHDLDGVLVEVTDHEAAPDDALLQAPLAALRARGARVAVDDAGAGSATLRRVLVLQPDVIKLDRALTREAAQVRQAQLVRALVAFAREVGMQVLAEGVEHEEQVQVLLDLGVTLGQGWHLGVPVPVGSAPRSPAS